MALMKAFDDSTKTGGDKVNHSFIELQQAIITYIQKIPGNDRCCDCNSQNGKHKLYIFNFKSEQRLVVLMNKFKIRFLG